MAQTQDRTKGGQDLTKHSNRKKLKDNHLMQISSNQTIASHIYTQCSA